MLWTLYVILVFVALLIEDHISTKRHIRLFKQVLEEELRRLKAESLSTPGGDIDKEVSQIQTSINVTPYTR